jgi:hypothetical protein
MRNLQENKHRKTDIDRICGFGGEFGPELRDFRAQFGGSTGRKLVFGARMYWRCAGEGELVFGLTKHAASLTGGVQACQNVIYAALVAV